MCGGCYGLVKLIEALKRYSDGMRVILPDGG
jgi:protein-disulfide isomerase-like protein with CxxC motif